MWTGKAINVDISHGRPAAPSLRAGSTPGLPVSDVDAPSDGRAHPAVARIAAKEHSGSLVGACSSSASSQARGEVRPADSSLKLSTLSFLSFKEAEGSGGCARMTAAGPCSSGGWLP